MRLPRTGKAIYRAAMAALLLLAAAASASAASGKPGPWRPIEERETLYNNIVVFEDGPHRVMTFGYNGRHYVESRFNPSDPRELPVPYTRLMTIAAAYRPTAENLLMIGLGGGRTSRYLFDHMPELQVTAVELDPGVVDLAKKYFGIQETPRYRIEVADGRVFLMKNKGPWDIILVDAYRGPFVPFHLLTREFYELLKTRLRMGGRMLQNIETTTMLFDSAVATMKSAFDNVEFFPAGGNVVAIAYDGPRIENDALLRQARESQNSFNFPYDLPGMATTRRAFSPETTVEPMTDDFAPVNTLQAIERHNVKWQD